MQIVYLGDNMKCRLIYGRKSIDLSSARFAHSVLSILKVERFTAKDNVFNNFLTTLTLRVLGKDFGG